MKTCKRCNTSKTLESFHKGSGQFGKHSWCKSCVSKNRTAAYRKDPDSRRRHARWNKYRLRQEDLDRMLEEQEGTCIICPKKIVENFHIDHDHATGAVRGLLCVSCNTRLGWYEKNKAAVLEYLSR